MTWLSSMWDQLPLLLVLAPVIGFLVTSAAVQTNSEAVRELAISNVICTLLILGGLAWTFESDLAAEALARHPAPADIEECGTLDAAQAMVHRRVDRQIAERLGRRQFVIDGINLWPLLMFVVLTGCVVWRAGRSIGNPSWFVPTVLLFEAASIGALTANDLQIFLVTYGSAALAMGGLLGWWGGLERRGLAVRFLTAQYCGGSLIMFGFAMLVVAVPWMKMEDAPTPPEVTQNLSSIIHEIQKWTTTNGLAYQYAIEVFPWMLLILSLGFAIQFGLFPFHSTQIEILSTASPVVIVLYLGGILSACGVGWLRFVVPLAPEMIVSLDWLMLVPSLGGALWAALASLAPSAPRRQAACIYSSLSAVSLMGCFTLTRFGMSAAWLMQQQLTVVICLGLLALDLPDVENSFGRQLGRSLRSGYSTRTVLLVLAVSCVGLFASGFIIVSELFRDSLLLVATIPIVSFSVCTTIYLLFNRHFSDDAVEAERSRNPLTLSPQSRGEGTSRNGGGRGSLAILLSLAIIANLFPGLMLHQCEPDFARVFRRFERTETATSADLESNERQSSP